jgi:hypothetical protein
MKIVALNMMIIFVLFSQCAFAAETQTMQANDKCTTINLKANIQSFWYVPTDRPRVHFVALPDGESLNKYLIKGDLIIASTETPEFICAHYIKKGKVVTSGWLKKTEIEMFKLVSFGDFEVKESQKKIPQANKALISLAKRLPEIMDWHGNYQDKYKNRVKIWKKGSIWRLNTMGIIGAIGAGNEEEDSQDIVTSGARAEYRDNKAKYDVCDIVIIGFNNALLATSGSHCMGSGANHEYPEFSGLYWKH